MASHFWRPRLSFAIYRPQLSNAILFARLSLPRFPRFHDQDRSEERHTLHCLQCRIVVKEKKKKLSLQSLCSWSSTKRAATFSFIVIHVRFQSRPLRVPLFPVDGLRNILCAPFVSVILKKWRSKGQRLLPQDDRKSRLRKSFFSSSSPVFLPFFSPIPYRYWFVLRTEQRVDRRRNLYPRMPAFQSTCALSNIRVLRYLDSRVHKFLDSRVCEHFGFRTLVYELPIF